MAAQARAGAAQRYIREHGGRCTLHLTSDCPTARHDTHSLASRRSTSGGALHVARWMLCDGSGVELLSAP